MIIDENYKFLGNNAASINIKKARYFTTKFFCKLLFMVSIQSRNRNRHRNL